MYFVFELEELEPLVLSQILRNRMLSSTNPWIIVLAGLLFACIDDVLTSTQPDQHDGPAVEEAPLTILPVLVPGRLVVQSNTTPSAQSSWNREAYILTEWFVSPQVQSF